MHFRYKDIINYLLLFHFNTLQPKADAEKNTKSWKVAFLLLLSLKLDFTITVTYLVLTVLNNC